MNEPQVVDYDSDPQLAWVMRMFAQAKETLVEAAASGQDFTSVCFLESTGRLDVIGLGFHDEETERGCARLVRHRARSMGATTAAAFFDIKVRTAVDDPRSREALFATVEVEGGRRRLTLVQFYRRQGRAIVFEECIDGGAYHGQFSHLLSHIEAGVKDGLVEAMQQLRKAGFTAKVTDEAIEILTPEGGRHSYVESASYKDDFGLLAALVGRAFGS
jgi:hypothetical protein